MACNVVQSPCHVPSSVADHNSSKPHENAPDHFVADGEQSNKVSMPCHCWMLLRLKVKRWILITRPCHCWMFGSEEIDLGHEVPDHSCLREDEMPSVGMCFAQLEMAHEFYVSYAKKVKDGFRRSRVKASTRKNTISAVGCKARIYVKFDKEKQEWIFLKVELRHSHPCSARKAVHYHEYRKLTMHAKCVIEDNDEAGIRPNKTFLTLTNEARAPSNLGFSEKDLRNYITARL
ncbi:hypothetical protein Ahy_A01g002117 [Arachis hypogaea]|uniref:FAR1 domain-containing protein n=1 Tax=Arachis hypogaea TaxID=3818 RepID=A0A445EQ35_ARAHY|nr:hypothetical protein Ahy_A01g002117 [Arachis hypogaea]